jgi:DNA helicase-2/ATP-dependent DNA helicase PcrA
VEYLDSLNERQKEAVLYGNGPLLVLAGAGSGKTRVLTCRIARLIHDRIARPHQILAVTFTNKAAGEMKERIRRLLRIESLPWLGTFHSIGVRILRRENEAAGIERNFAIYDQSDQVSVVRECLRELNLDEKAHPASAVLGVIGRLKGRLVEPAEAARSSSGYFEDLVARIYPLYQKKLAQNGALDFDDLIMKTVLLLKSNQVILVKYQEQFLHVLIDEYQDINYSQYVLIKMLAQKNRNLFAVGDDDQSIYGFRGADVSLILRFEKDFPEAHIVKLEQNYRSTRTILDAANQVVRNNEGRKAKTLWTDNSEGEKIEAYCAVDERDEAAWITDEIKSLMARGRSCGDFVILYRTNAQSRNFEERLIREGLPYKLIGNVRFYDRKEIKDVLAYLRLITNGEDNVNFRRIINVPSRGIGAVTLDRLSIAAGRAGKSLFSMLEEEQPQEGIPAKTWEKLRQFHGKVLSWRKKAEHTGLTRLIQRVVEESGYRQSLEAEMTAEAIARLENVEELYTVAQEFEKKSEDATLENFLSEISLLTDLDGWDESVPAVTLMTLHAAKGLEFPVVFLSGLEEGLFPHSRSLQSAREIEEERRLCYVGMTRSREKLYLTRARCRSIFGLTMESIPSRFLREVPPSRVESREGMEWSLEVPVIPEPRPLSRRGGGSAASRNKTAEAPFKTGDPVLHKLWGEGTVISARDDEIRVLFPEKGEKLIQASFLSRKNGSSGSPGARPGDKVNHERWGEGILIQAGGTPIAAFPGVGLKAIRNEECR